ncbi:MAG: cell cycle transcriptional regulator TrcR [Pseudomonadota bacterium]
MALPLMPKATAIWLVENTKLTFEQIADFCGMHPLEIQGIADGEVAIGINGSNPISSGQVKAEDIERCESNPELKLALSPESEKFMLAKSKAKGGRYTPVSRRQDKPDAVSWFVKFHPTVPDAQIIKLIGTTKNTINTVRSRSHWNSTNIKPKDPVLLGLRTQTRLDEVIEKFSSFEQEEQHEKTKKIQS